MAARNGASTSSLEMANSNQELVTRVAARRWRYLGLAVAAAVTLGVIATIAVLLRSTDGDDAGGQSQKDALTLDDVLKRRFSPRTFNATWISDTELSFDEGEVPFEPVLFDVKTKQKRSPFKTNITLDYQTFQVDLSADRKYALEVSSYRPIYRHSFLALYKVIDVEKGNSTYLTIPHLSEPVYAQLVLWGPTGSSLVMVVGNDIYYRPEALAPSIRITTTGLTNTISNGVPDWVYEEEVLSSNQAVWFSPDGNRIAFATYNDTAVPIMTLPYYGKPGDLRFQYPQAVNVRYPKPGTNNPEVTLTVFDLRSMRSVNIPPPEALLKNIRSPLDLPVLAVTQWVPDDPEPRVLAVWMNRVQNHAVIQVCSVRDAAGAAQCTTLDEPRPDQGWVDLFEAGETSEDGVSGKGKGSVIMLLSQPVGNDHFKHVVRFDPTKSDRSDYKKTALTNGSFVVTSILAWDSDNGYVYFESTKEGDPAYSLVQRVRDDPADAPYEPECLSCRLGDDCRYATASLSKAGSFVALSCTGPGVPYTVIQDARATKEADKQVMTWERNEGLRQALASRALPVKMRTTVDLPGGFKAQVMLWLPPNADLSGNTKYPMVVDVYGGPNSFRVSERFATDWGTYLSANKSIIYAAIDGRGSANKGDNVVFSIYHKFGEVEVEDQIHVTKKLQEKYSYIDASRTAIWGWSYGGYASAMALAKDKENVFKCGISVAPVTDWIYYDSIYTERYMGLPVGDNIETYRKAQLTNKVENMRNKLFLLVHGTLDDNVHYQQSMMLSRALEENDILFRQQSYPDEEHGIVHLQSHLYHTLQNFLMECFE